MGFDRMPVFARQTALARLDFADLVAKTPAICVTAGPFPVPRARPEASRLRAIASAQRDLHPVPSGQERKDEMKKKTRSRLAGDPIDGGANESSS